MIPLKRTLPHYETEEMGFRGEPIWVRTLSSHWRGPWRWISIQHGVLVTSCRWYSAPQPWERNRHHSEHLSKSVNQPKPTFTHWQKDTADIRRMYLNKDHKTNLSIHHGVKSNTTAVSLKEDFLITQNSLNRNCWSKLFQIFFLFKFYKVNMF